MKITKSILSPETLEQRPDRLHPSIRNGEPCILRQRWVASSVGGHFETLEILPSETNQQ